MASPSDRALLALLAERQRYMDAAARIKPDRSVVHDQARIEDVVTKVLAAATHGIFSGKAFERLGDSVIEEIVVTDTIPVPEGSAGGKIQILSVDRILADTIHNVFCDESVSEIFAGENQLF